MSEPKRKRTHKPNPDKSPFDEMKVRDRMRSIMPMLLLAVRERDWAEVAAQDHLLEECEKQIEIIRKKHKEALDG